MRRFAAIVGIVVLFGACASEPSGGAAASTPVWQDEFTGRAGQIANPAIWSSVTGADGWGNNELECYTNARENSALNGHGQLVLTARHEVHRRCADGRYADYTSARLTTRNLKSMQYGSLRVRAYLPSASGTWPAIWLLPVHPLPGRPGELDVVEKIGATPYIAYATLHGPNVKGQEYEVGGRLRNAPGGWHVYGMDWSQTQISMSIDGHTYLTVSRAAVTKSLHYWVFDQPFYLLLNVAVGGSWPGTPKNPSAYPQRMYVDYVRVYR